MKRIWILTVGLLMVAGGLHAEPAALLDNKANWEIGGMGSLSAGAASFNGDFVPQHGSRAQLILNHTLGIGLASSRFRGLDEYDWQDNKYDMTVESGGIDLEYYLVPDNLVHGSLYLLIGGGQIVADQEGSTAELKDSFFCIQPQANAEVNLTSWWRLAAGIGYCFASGVDVVGLDNSDLSGVTANVTMKFGKF